MPNQPDSTNHRPGRNGDDAARPSLLIEVLAAEYEQHRLMDARFDPLLIATHDQLGEIRTSDTEKLRALGAEIWRAAQAATDPTQCEKLLDEKQGEPIKAFYRGLHKQAKERKVKRAALCFSGGGIRSATFVLGLLQGLARHGVRLNQFHYVSTVSGGGYIGSWLSAWIHRQGIDCVQEELARSAPKHRPMRAEAAAQTQEAPGASGAPADEAAAQHKLSPLDPEPEPIQHLRRYSNYMSPKLGLLSADTWTLVATFLRNLLLNWSVLIPLIIGVLAVPRIAMAAVTWENPPGWVPLSLFGASLLLGFVAVAFIVLNRPSLFAPRLKESERSRRLRSETGFLRLCLAPLVLSSIAATSFWAWNQQVGGRFGAFAPALDFLRGWQAIVPDWLANFLFWAPFDFVLFGIVFHLGGYLVFRLVARRLPDIRRSQIGWWDFLYSLITGGLGGLGLWLIAYQVLALPLGAKPGPYQAAYYVCFAASSFLLMILLATTFFVGFMSYFTSDADREWLARAGGWVWIAITVWCVGSAIVIFGPMALLYAGLKTKALLLSLGAGSGVVTLAGGYGDKTAATAQEAGAKKQKPGMPASLLKLLLPLAAPLFIVSILALLSLGVSLLIKLIWLPEVALDAAFHLKVLHQAHTWEIILLSAGIALVGVVMGFFVNVNKFSLHSAYRDRLIRAYMGASRSSAERRPNPFTGMDEGDNLQMHQLLTDLFYPESFDSRRLPELLRQLAAEDEVSQFIRQKLGADWLPRDYQPLKQAATGEEKREDLETRRRLAAGLNRIVQRFRLHDQCSELIENAPQYRAVKDLIAAQPIVPWISRKINDWLASRSWLRRFPPIERRVNQCVVVEWLRANRLFLEATYDALPRLAESQKRPRPLHVVNIALNLVGGKELAWQERKAQPFTASPLHAGSHGLGYRRVSEYAINRKQSGALSLGTAMAISGAAVSPNMGYNSSSVVTFLLSLFNVRLGWWLGNPGAAGESTYQQPGPAFAPRPMLAETFGMTDSEHPYAYLSDGAHFENLALYEMVRRRCHFIILSDAGADGDFNFDDLGNALRKIRIDLGVPIEFHGDIPIRSREKPDSLLSPKDDEFMRARRYCAFATIRYSAVDGGKPEDPEDPEDVDGKLVYIKPTVYGCEPPDVLNYAKAHGTFPHETTGDQMYSESQFESYRALGAFVIEQITGNSKADEQDTVGWLVGKVGDYAGCEKPV